MKQTKNLEIVYLLSNPSMPNIYKIGCTKTNDVTERMKNLYTTGVPTPFQCLRACKVDDCKKAEAMLHKAFAKYRIAPNREFFKIDEIDAILAIYEYINQDGIDITTDIRTETDENMSDIDRSAINNIERIQKSPKLNFKAMGIPIGTRLQFIKDGNIEVEVADETNKISYNGTKMTLTKITKQILGVPQKKSLRPTGMWLCEGRNLLAIYNEILAK